MIVNDKEPAINGNSWYGAAFGDKELIINDNANKN